MRSPAPHYAPRRLVPVILASLLLCACAGEPETHVLWGGFGFDWETLSHRIGYLRSGSTQPEGEGSFDLELGLIGGPWSLIEESPEQITFLQPWWAVKSKGFSAFAGALDLSIGPEGVAEETVRLSWADSGLSSEGRYAVLLGGFGFDMNVAQTADYPNDYPAADGWTPQALGAGVGAPVVDSEGLSFQAWLKFVPGPLDREDMNQALPFATIGGSLRYLVVALDEGAMTEASFAASAYYAADPPNTPIGELSEAERTVSVDGEAGWEQAVPGLRSFEVALSESLGLEGRYLRALRTAIESFEYEAGTGQSSFQIDAYGSHSSFFEEGDLELRFSVGLLLVQWGDAEAVIQSGAFRETLPVGPQTSTVSL